MTSLTTALAAHSALELRSIATHLAVRTEAQTRKAEWIAAIAGYWQHVDNRAQAVQQLSPAAQRALWWLCHTTALPAQPFWNEFGTVRRARDRQRGQPAPWQQPATAAEELFYSGLLHSQPAATAATGVPAPALERTNQLMVPAALRRHLAGLLTTAQPLPAADADPPFPAHTAGVPPHTLVHDLGQYLIYLHQIRIQQPQPLALLHNRWLAPRHLQAVAARLASPQASQALRSHKSNRWLCLLAFLATTAGLHDAGQLTAHGWAWLAQPPSTQLALLWHSWQQTDWEVRAAYAQADGAFPVPWPTLLCAALAAVPAPFTPADLAAQLFRRANVLATYWNLYLESLQQLVDRLAALCGALLTPLGIIVPPDPPVPPSTVDGSATDGRRHYTLTPLGRTLVQAATATVAPPIAIPAIPLSPPAMSQTIEPPAQLTVDESHSHITITFPTPVSSAPNALSAQAAIAGFADYTGREMGIHHYQITAATLARAAAQELGLAGLAAALQSLAIPVTPPLWQALQAGYAQGQQLHLQPATLLRASDTTQLAALHQQRPLAALFAEILSPTTALLAVDPTTALATLQQHGYSAQSPQCHTTTQPSATPVALSQPDRERLWLAGQLYSLLAEHLPLPVPPSTQPLHALYATLPVATQAALAAQRQVLAEQLRSLLDNLPFTPPLEPSDPAAWIPLIDGALEQKQLLQMSYFTAGRNLTTHRLVEPYWREEHRGVPYLRAYCHSAGRVLTFRLDRVEALVVMKRET